MCWNKPSPTLRKNLCFEKCVGIEISLSPWVRSLAPPSQFEESKLDTWNWEGGTKVRTYGNNQNTNRITPLISRRNFLFEKYVGIPPPHFKDQFKFSLREILLSKRLYLKNPTNSSTFWKISIQNLFQFNVFSPNQWLVVMRMWWRQKRNHDQKPETCAHNSQRVRGTHAKR